MLASRAGIITPMFSRKILIPIIVLGLLCGLGAYLWTTLRSTASRGEYVWRYLRDPQSQAALMLKMGTRCGDAPFLFPTDGLVGFLWDDSFRPGHRHSGIDIFAGTAVGVTPVISAYPGYLTRLETWKSSVIVRVPADPLFPGRQIWLYYTHLADAEGNSLIDAAFPPGTREKFVEAGELLGFQGNYSGNPANPVGVHLHFSVVKDDGAGNYLNELDIDNTYDPSPYLGLALNAHENPEHIPVCEK
jgi:peptidoglycan LD-endopeptidase LytH